MVISIKCGDNRKPHHKTPEENFKKVYSKYMVDTFLSNQ